MFSFLYRFVFVIVVLKCAFSFANMLYLVSYNNLPEFGNCNYERMLELKQVPIIMEKLHKVQSKLRQLQSEVETVDVLFKKYTDRKERFEQVTEIMKILVEDVKELQSASDKRILNYNRTESYFVMFVKHSFKKVLELRQFKGNLEIDMKDQKLDLVVIPKQGSQGATSTSHLSGGEKSFSTVAFLYSLWQCMEFPFYFLDEFDVFMDKVNRSKVMEILIYHAKCQRDLQFVFLTPQDISFLNDKAVTIHRLEDPERDAFNED